MQRTAWFAFPFVLGSLAVPASARAQWQPNGIPVCTNGSIQSNPLATRDGTGGSYIAWVDYRGGRTDVYLQRVTADGFIAPGWPQDGVGVCTAAESQYVSSLSSDGAGGVYVAWFDFRDRSSNDADVYVQRIMGDGTVAPGWPVDGLAVAALPGVQDLPRLASDGAGGVFVAWDDERSGSSSTADVYLQRITPEGENAPGWPLGGKNLCAAAGAQLGPAIVADGQGGVFVAWGDTRDFSASSTDVYASRITAGGALFPGWTTDGNAICTAPGVQGIRAVAPDASGGIYMAWQDWRTAPPDDPFGNAYSDVYLQHVSGAGALDPAWPVDGFPACTATYLQQTISLAADATGGALLSWEDYRSFVDADVYVQRVTASGSLAPGWPTDGLLACTAAGYQVGPVLAADSQGGAYLAFESVSGTHVVVAQHISGSATPAPGWAAEGIGVAMAPGIQGNPSITADGFGGAIAAWEDTRSGPSQYDIYAQRLAPTGPTPAQVALASAETEPGLVRLTWYAADGASLAASVERRTETEEWLGLGTITADGTGRLTYEDRTVASGTRYAYRLTYSDEGTVAHTPDTWVSVPALTFALRGLTPNPSAGDPVVAFSLPSAEPATLELYDLSGRLMLAREVGSLGVGAHSITLDARGRFTAGVYTIRLRQGALVATVRAVMIR